MSFARVQQPRLPRDPQDLRQHSRDVSSSLTGGGTKGRALGDPYSTSDLTVLTLLLDISGLQVWRLEVSSSHLGLLGGITSILTSIFLKLAKNVLHEWETNCRGTLVRPEDP